MRKITKIQPPVPSLPTRKRVAAYARVSVEKGRTLNSLSAQVSYYSAFIQKNPEWEYVGVYADSGETGTAKNRTEFQRLVADCEAGKVDIILTKTISRFARNTVDLLETVRRLRELGVEVRFEEQNINSMSGDGELMMTILASFAQEEARSISENAKWAVQKRFSKGVPNSKFRIFGYDWDYDRLVIVPEEAAVVRRIFDNFIAGKSRLETEREFEAEGIRTKLGYRFCDSNIKVILTNVTYTGNLLLQKEFIEDPITKKRKKNRGELPQYFIEDTHEPIIDRATFDYVQSEMARRKELGAFANKSLNITCFTSMIKCESCDRSFVRNTRTNKAAQSNLGDKLVSWVCSSKKRKGGKCATRELPERILKRICAEALGLADFDGDVFLEKVERIIVPEHGILVFHFKDGTVVNKTWVNNSKKESWTPELRAAHSERLRKRVYTEEQRQARSERMKARWVAERGRQE